MLVTKQLTVAIDFHGKEKMATANFLSYQTLTQVWNKWRVHFHFWVNYPFKWAFESDFQCDLRLLGLWYMYVYVYNT